MYCGSECACVTATPVTKCVDVIDVQCLMQANRRQIPVVKTLELDPCQTVLIHLPKALKYVWPVGKQQSKCWRVYKCKHFRYILMYISCIHVVV